MGNRGMVYTVRVQRGDGGWINYRTCDRHEATRIAARFNVNLADNE